MDVYTTYILLLYNSSKIIEFRAEFSNTPPLRMLLCLSFYTRASALRIEPMLLFQMDHRSYHRAIAHVCEGLFILFLI